MKTHWLIAVLVGMTALTQVTGCKGDKGDKGDAGAAGPKGDKGDKGEDGTCPGCGGNSSYGGGPGTATGFTWRTCAVDGECSAANYGGAHSACAASTLKCVSHLCRATLASGKQCYPGATMNCVSGQAGGTVTATCSALCGWEGCQ